MRAATVLAGLVMAIVVGNAPAIIAEASAVTPGCLTHLSGVDKANTPAADRRYHLERGQPSPCTEADANESQTSTSVQPAPVAEDESHDEDNKKSRYCRKKWYC